jgi:hypothetical protein
MVYERRQPRRSADDWLVGRFTRRETAAQRAHRLARQRIDVPEDVINEFDQRLNKDTVREARALAQQLTTSPSQETRTMATTKRNAITKKAEPTTDAKATDVEKVADDTKPKSAKKPKAKASKKAKGTTERAKANARYTKDKLKVQAKFKVNSVMTYHGRVSDLDGQTVKIVCHEGRGGIFVEYKGDRYTVSPFALEKKSDLEKKS